MARVTVEDCLEREDNRFALVVLASQRARQLMKGAGPLVQSKNKAAVTALREIAAGSLAHYEDPAYYTATYARRIEDVAFYVDLARRAGGPVLEYGVGNGR